MTRAEVAREHLALVVRLIRIHLGALSIEHAHVNEHVRHALDDDARTVLALLGDLGATDDVVATYRTLAAVIAAAREARDAVSGPSHDLWEDVVQTARASKASLAGA